MILKDKKVLIMGIRNKWSIAYGAAQSAYEQGAKLIFTFMGEENRSKIEELIAEFEGSKAYELDASDDEAITRLFTQLHKEYGQIDGILHSIAHANTEDLKNDFINTSKAGFAHANDVSAYTIISITRAAKETGLIGEGSSVVALTYHGSTKVLPGYNVMGVAKAALECSIRY